MQSEVFIIKFVPLKSSFLYFSEKWINSFSNLRNAVLKVNSESNRVSYFSWSRNNSLADNTVGINAAYAHALELQEGSTVTVSILKEVAVLQKIVVTPISHDDWEILELNAQLIQNTLLNFISVVFRNQKFVIWISKTVSLVVRIDSLIPMVEVGRLENFTEVEIIPVKSCSSSFELQDDESDIENHWSWSNLLRKLSFNHNEEISEKKPYPILKKYKKFNLKIACRVHLLAKFDNISTTDEIKTILEQPFNVYIYKKYLPKHFFSHSKKTVRCKLTKILPPDNENEENEDIFVNLIIIDNFKLLPKILFPNLNHSTLFVCENVKNILNIRVGGKVMLDSDIAVQPEIDEIQVQPFSNVDSSTLEHNFKLYVLENSKNNDLLLNSNYPVKLSDSVYCNVKFIPQKIKFAKLNGNILRNVKISMNVGKLENTNSKISKFNNSDNNSNTILNLINYLQFSKLYMPVESAIKTLQFGLHLFGQKPRTKVPTVQNILITGQIGSGKTTLAKIICQKLSEEPDCVYIKVINCKSLKGKRVETIQKMFVQSFEDCLYYQPSVLFLDDLDIICGAPEEAAEGVVSSEANYFNRMSEMLNILLTTYQTYNFISLIVTACSTSKLNKHLYNSRGHHLFSTIVETPILEKADRREIFKFILSQQGHISELIDYFDDLALKTEGYVFQDLVDLSNKCIFESIKRGESSSSDKKYNISLDDVDNALKNTIPLSFHDINLHKAVGRKWNEIGGLNQAKEVLIETIQWPVQYPEIFSSCPIPLQNGVLLYGHPGTGKTILAGAAAQHFGLRLISIKGPELLSKYIGASEESVRKIFEKAQSAKPCILFFDEFDSLAPRRGHDSTGVTDRVVNQLLTQLDGVESLNGVYVIAATSRPDLLDPALIRPGRLGKQVHCPLPNQTDRLAILKALSSDLELDDDVSLIDISKHTKGFTGADLQAVLYTAQLLAVDEVIADEESKTKLSSNKVKIFQIHLLDALKQIKPSLSSEERLKFDRIYAAFQGKEEKPKGAIRKQRVTLA